MKKNKVINVCARLILFLLLAAMLSMFVIGVLPLIPEKTYAVENEGFDNTDVMDDLESAGVDFQKYPYIENGRSPKLFNFVEYAYSFKKSIRAHYGLYLYVYNQQGLDVDETSVQNKVQMAVAYNSEGLPSHYEKFDLQFLSKSKTPGYENLFYKYKIIDHKSQDGLYIVDRVQSTARRYDVSGFELLTRGAANATEYKVGGTFTYTGYAKGCGAVADGESSLNCTVNDLETITLDVRTTYWRNPIFRESRGVKTQDEIVSVYFSIDDKILAEYGELQKIHASWLELQSKSMLVTDNSFLYNEMSKYTGLSLDYDKNVPLSLYAGMQIFPAANNFNTVHYNFSWNKKLEDRMGDLGYLIKSNYAVNQVPFVFTSSGFVDSATVRQYAYDYDKSFVNGTIPTKTKPISADLFKNAGTAKEVNVDADERVDLMNTPWDVYNSLDFGEWFLNLFNPDKYSSYEDIELIKKVPKNVHFSEDVANSYFIDKSDVGNFKQFCFQEELKQKTVVLFRYRISDYRTIPEVGYSYNYKNTNEVGYLAEMGVDLDFDIIDLTFNKDGIYTVIPVVMSPIDIFNPITPPPEGFDLFGMILAIIIAIVVLIILAPILPYLLKAVVWAVALPFRAVGGILRVFSKK